MKTGEIGLMYLKIRNAKDCQYPPVARKKAQNGFSLRASRMKNPADILILGFGLQDCERINICGFKPQIFVMAAPGNKYHTFVFLCLVWSQWFSRYVSW